MRHTDHRTITTTFAAALGLLALTACPDPGGNDTDTDASEGSTSGDTTAGPTTTNPQTSDTSEGDTTQSPTTGSSSEGTTGEPIGLLPRVIEAIGGEQALGELTQVEIVAAGTRYVADEGYMPGGPAVEASSFDTRTGIDFESGSLRLDITRNPLYIPTGVPFVITELVEGNLGYVDGLENLFGGPPGHDMLSDRWASTVKQQRLLNPHFLLKELLVDPSPASEIGPADFDGVAHERLEVEDAVFPVTLWVDTNTNLITRLTTMENAHLHRDVELDLRYYDWQSTADGVLFPHEVQLWHGGELIHDELRSEVASNPELPADAFALPPESTAVYDEPEAIRGTRNHQHNQLFTSIGIPNDGLQTFIDADEVAPGVWFLGGGSHHTVVVEQASGLVVLEAPLYPQRCEAILDWIDVNLASAPVTHVVLSHHHEDHVSCARTFVATGATLVVHETSEAYFGEVLAAPSTIEPDRLEENPVRNPVVELVPSGGSYTLDDASNPITVYELTSTHAQDLVFAFIESAGVALTVDIFNPGFPANPYGAAEVLDAFDAAGVTPNVNLVVGGHGFGYATLADVQAAAGG